MSHDLSTEVKNHMLIFISSEKRQPIYITESKASTIRAFLSDRGANFMDITDDDGSYSETVQKRLIKGVQRIRIVPSEERRWVCDCGRKNPMTVWPSDKCECKKQLNEPIPKEVPESSSQMQ